MQKIIALISRLYSTSIVYQKVIMVAFAIFLSGGGVILFSYLPTAWIASLESPAIYWGNASVTQGNIVIIAVDDKTLDRFSEINNSFVSLGSAQYDIYAQVVNRVRKAGAKGVAFDIVFANASSGGAADNFAQVLRSSGAHTIGLRSGDQGIKNNRESTNCSQLIIDGKLYNTYQSGSCTSGSNEPLSTNSLSRRLAPSDLFREVNQGFINQELLAGYALLRHNFLPDQSASGSVRVPSLALSLFRQISPDAPILQKQISDRIERFSYFQGKDGQKAYPYYSLSDVYEGKVLDASFSGKVVFIGEAGTLIHDSVLSPIDLGREIPGVETHAHYYESLDREMMIKDMSKLVAGGIQCSIIFLMAFAVCTVSRLRFVIIAGVCLSIAGVIAARFLLHLQVYVPLFSFLVCGTVTFIISFFLRYLFIDRQKKAIRQAFAHYLDEGVIRDIEHAGELVMSNQSVAIAVIFSDIESFSTYSERLGTDKIFQLMSLYLSTMTDILQKHGATLDKYIGDAVMGFIGAPKKVSPEVACQSAIRIVHDWQQALPGLNSELRSRGLLTAQDGSSLADIRFRVGVSYGDAIVGNIGSKDRVSYTAMGDSVNIASRLEAINKYYGTYAMITDSIYCHLSSDMQSRCSMIDRITVKGKGEPVSIYEYFSSHKTHIDERFDELMSSYFLGQFTPGNIASWELLAKETKKAQFLVEHGHDVSKKYGEWDFTQVPPVFHFGEK